MTNEERLEAVSLDGWNLAFMPSQYCTEEMCIAAVKNYGAAIEFVPKKFWTEELCLCALRNDASQFGIILLTEFATEQVCIAAIKKDPRLYFDLHQSQRTRLTTIEFLIRSKSKFFVHKYGDELAPCDKLQIWNEFPYNDRPDEVKMYNALVCANDTYFSILHEKNLIAVICLDPIFNGIPSSDSC